MDPSLIAALHDAMTVARTGSVVAAAERLNKTPSAVSQQLRRLTDALGAPLFERRGRGVVLSPVGQQALPAITRLFDEAQALFGLLGDLAGTGGTLLRIAASDYLGRALLVPVLRRVVAEGSPVHFEIATVHSEEALRRLERGEVDLAIVSAAVTRAGVVARPLLSQSFFWVMPRRKGPGGRDLVKRLAREPLLRLEPGSVGRRLLERTLEDKALQPASTIDVPSVSLLLAYSQAGLGIGLVPALACVGLPASRVTLLRAELPSFPVQLVTRSQWGAGPAAERFVAELVHEAERRAAALPARLR